MSSSTEFKIDTRPILIKNACSANVVAGQEYKFFMLEETDDGMIFGSPEIPENNQKSSSSNTIKPVSPFFVYKIPLTEKIVLFKSMK